MKALKFVLGALLLTFALTASVYAQSISKVVVLGDSLSDIGNMYAATSGVLPPSPPYWQGRASNGPVAVEYLAQNLGVPLKDYAYYGAKTGVGNIVPGLPGLTAELAKLSAAGPLDPDALYIVWGGPNDFWTVTGPADAAAAIGTAVSNLVTIIGTLHSLGATRILVPNMPDLGRTPRFLAIGPQASALATQISLGFNQLLKISLPPGVHYFDTFSFLSNVGSNPGRYGFVNVTEPCLTASGVCANPDDYFSFDVVHPTTAVHKLLGNALYESAALTVIIDACDSGVPNELLSTGISYSDLIRQATFGVNTHGQFVSTVASILKELEKSGAISGKQKGAIQSCAAKGQIP